MLYKHKHNTDVAIEILKSFYVPEKDLYKFKVRWWRVGSTKYPDFCMNITQKIEIPRETWRKDWSKYV